MRYIFSTSRFSNYHWVYIYKLILILQQIKSFIGLNFVQKRAFCVIPPKGIIMVLASEDSIRCWVDFVPSTWVCEKYIFNTKFEYKVELSNLTLPQFVQHTRREAFLLRLRFKFIANALVCVTWYLVIKINKNPSNPSKCSTRAGSLVSVNPADWVCHAMHLA